MNEKAYWIALSSVPGIGPVRFAALLEIFQSPGDVWHASVQQLLAARLDKRALTQLLETRRSIKPAELWRRLEVAGVSALTWLDTTYPSNLRHVDGAPPVLYCRGTLDELDRWAVAIVGTRRASVYGKEVAHRLATRLAARFQTAWSIAAPSTKTRASSVIGER